MWARVSTQLRWSGFQNMVCVTLMLFSSPMHMLMVGIIRSTFPLEHAADELISYEWLR
jgi:hypothetical protein